MADEDKSAVLPIVIAGGFQLVIEGLKILAEYLKDGKVESAVSLTPKDLDEKIKKVDEIFAEIRKKALSVADSE